MIAIQRALSILSAFLLSQCLMERIFNLKSLKDTEINVMISLGFLLLALIFIILGELRGQNFLEFFKFYDNPYFKAIFILLISGSIYAGNGEKNETFNYYSALIAIVGIIMLAFAPCSGRKEYKRGKKII